jgi:hypothetical protein
MANLQRPNTSCQMYRSSLNNDDKQVNSNGKNLVTRSYTFDEIQSIKQREEKQQQQQQQLQRQQSAKPPRPSPPVVDQQPQRLGRSLLSNDNWRQETMADVRVNAKAIEQSDQNILYGKGKKKRNKNQF